MARLPYWIKLSRVKIGENFCSQELLCQLLFTHQPLFFRDLEIEWWSELWWTAFKNSGVWDVNISFHDWQMTNIYFHQWISRPGIRCSWHILCWRRYPHLKSVQSSCNVRCANTFYIVLSTISWIRCAMSCGLCAFVAEHFSVYVLFVPCRWVSQWQTIVWWAVSGGAGGCNHIAIHEDGPCSWDDRRREMFFFWLLCVSRTQ